MNIDNNVFAILEKFFQKKVLVVGEAILESVVRGSADRLSLEAPVPVVDARETSETAGGAANVAVNLARLGASVELLSIVGRDYEGENLLALLRSQGVGVDRVIRDTDRKTLLKRRIYADSTLIVRYDQGTTDPADEKTEAKLMKELTQLCGWADVVLLSDYGLGVLSNTFLADLAQLQGRRPCVLVADTRRLEDYRGLALAAVRPSYQNVMDLVDSHDNDAVDPLMRLTEAGEKILDTINTRMAAITLDSGGALILDLEQPVYRTYAQEMAFNKVSGAGDAFIAALALSLASGADSPAAGEIASAWASIVVKNDGLPACCIDELRSMLGGDRKLVEDWPSLGARLETLRRQGKRVVFTNGVFDILHSAHVAYLNQAKACGDILVIGVNSDESVKRLKGPTRPVNHMIERMKVLAGLSCVDFVTCFTGDNPIDLIHVVRPDVYVKGGDYTRETLPESEVVERYGGRLEIVNYIANHSTTGVIERIRNMDEQVQE